jgi:hypothetical protein
VDEHGKTVRFSAQPSQQVYERMQRALPGGLGGVWTCGVADGHGSALCLAASCTASVLSCRCRRTAHCLLRPAAGSAHCMFLISTKQLAPAGAPGGRAQEFVVLGATGNGAC